MKYSLKTYAIDRYQRSRIACEQNKATTPTKWQLPIFFSNYWDPPEVVICSFPEIRNRKLSQTREIRKSWFQTMQIAPCGEDFRRFTCTHRDFCANCTRRASILTAVSLSCNWLILDELHPIVQQKPYDRRHTRRHSSCADPTRWLRARPLRCGRDDNGAKWTSD